MRNSIGVAMAAVLAALVVAAAERPAAQRGQRVPEGFISEGIPKMPNPPGPAPKRDMSGAWVGPGASNKPDPVPPMTPAGQAAFKERKSYGVASRLGGQGGNQAGEPESNDPFITCDPLGFPRNLLAHAITARGGTLFATAPDRILIAYEQQRVWREIFMDGRVLPKAVDVRGAPESRFYGFSVGHWENDNTLVIDTTGFDDRAWLDEEGHPRSSMAHVTERYTRQDQYNIQLTVTVDDPKYYTKSWTYMRANLYWMKAQEFSESFCVPSEAIQYRDTLARPSGINAR